MLVEDISGGLERLPIPVINTVNDEPPPADLVYIKDYEFAPFVEELVRGWGWDGRLLGTCVGHTLDKALP